MVVLMNLCVPATMSGSRGSAHVSVRVSLTFHVARPGRLTSPGSRSDTSTISRLPPQRRTNSITTLSFSMGLKLHVEYTIRPPTLSISSARHAI